VDIKGWLALDIPGSGDYLDRDLSSRDRDLRSGEQAPGVPEPHVRKTREAALAGL
jgi:hypothetical protein